MKETIDTYSGPTARLIFAIFSLPLGVWKIIIKNKIHICYVVILTRVITTVYDLISDHLLQSFCGGAGPARQSSGHICKKKKMGKP